MTESQSVTGPCAYRKKHPRNTSRPARLQPGRNRNPSCQPHPPGQQMRCQLFLVRRVCNWRISLFPVGPRICSPASTHWPACLLWATKPRRPLRYQSGRRNRHHMRAASPGTAQTLCLPHQNHQQRPETAAASSSTGPCRHVERSHHPLAGRRLSIIGRQHRNSASCHTQLPYSLQAAALACPTDAFPGLNHRCHEYSLIHVLAAFTANRAWRGTSPADARHGVIRFQPP